MSTSSTPIPPSLGDAPANWIHLDFKGANPSEPALLEWLDWLSQWGFNGIVLEYENRLPWQSWPGTYVPGYDLDQWHRIWDHCRSLGLQITPLVQTHGHLEWVLKHERWSSWREAGHVNECCPQHPDVMPALITWLDEVIALHPDSPFIHVGGDETWHLASCPRCQEKTRSAPEGRLAPYLDHIELICQHVLSRGRRPMVWADMFWREKRPDLAARIPDGAVLVDWQYTGAGPFATTGELRESAKLSLFGASATRCYAPDHTLNTLFPLRGQIDNVLGWREIHQQGGVDGMIHTTWARGSGMMPLYGPWHGWVVSMIAAGHQSGWDQHPLARGVEVVDRVLNSVGPADLLDDALADLDKIQPSHPIETLALRWWKLSLRHHVMLKSLSQLSLGYFAWRGVEKYVGVDAWQIAEKRTERRELWRQLDAWEAEARSFWSDAQLSNGDEFFLSKVDNLRRFLEPDWTVGADASFS